jgi:hypothetical protein
MHRYWLATFALLLAAPLAPASAQPAFPAVRFNAEPPFRLAVGRVDIVDRDPASDVRIPLPPARALETWAHDRLLAIGGPDRLVFTIVRARAIDRPLRMEGGSLSAAETDQLSDRYDVIADVRLDIIDPSGRAVATAQANATRYQTVLESTLPDQRDDIWYEMTRRLMAQLAPELDRQIAANFAAYLR